MMGLLTVVVMVFVFVLSNVGSALAWTQTASVDRFYPRSVEEEATAEAAACDDPGSLCAMLSLVPDVLALSPDVSEVFSYANAAAQLDALGVGRPEDPEDAEFTRWSLAMTGVPISRIFLRYFEYWPEEMGFSLFDVDQSLEVGDFPDLITFLRGRFDEARVVEAWRSLGYQEVSVAGAAAWKLRQDYEIDLREKATTQLHHRNYAALLGSDVVVFTSNLAAMKSVLDVSRGSIAPLAARSDVADLVKAVGPEVATAHLVSGATMEIIGRLVLLSLTPGGPMPEENLRGTPLAWTRADDMRCLIAIKYQDGTDVETVATVTAGALEALSSQKYQTPYREIFAERRVIADGDRGLVLIELKSGKGWRPGIAVDLLYAHDLGFVA